ncbi:hypothetical protein VTN02DRAFT_1488 [Thermoascus thermophilus]
MGSSRPSGMDPERGPADLLVHKDAQLASLPPKTVAKLAGQMILDSDPDDYDTYMLFTRARNEGLYQKMPPKERIVTALRCLVPMDRASAAQVLRDTVPPGNIIHAVERLAQMSTVPVENAKQAVFRFVARCPRQRARRYSQARHRTVIDMILAARDDRCLSDTAATVACYAYFALLDPDEVDRIFQQEGGLEGDFDRFVDVAASRGLSCTDVARMRRWRPILRDEIQAILDSGRGSSEQQAREEYLIRRLIAQFHIDRLDATAALRRSHGDMEKAAVACGEYAKAARQRLAPQEPPTLPTRDTRCPPDVTPGTRVVAVLGTDDDDHDDTSRMADPALGDGWIVSDFYLWLHVLDGMGRSQEWITSMPPRDLVEKYGRGDEVTVEDSPVQTGWAPGLIHGDPFEERVVVLDKDTLPLVEHKVTIGPHGLALREFFLQRLEQTVSLAAAAGDPVLILMFAHGDYDSNGGLFVGVDPSSFPLDMDRLLKPGDVSKVLSRYAQVKVTIYMTSCFSGHWVETVEFQGNNNNKPTVLAAAQPDPEDSGSAAVLSPFQRHAGALFSAATLAELLKEPSALPPDADADASREYRELTRTITAEMYRPCLPEDIPAYGSTPVFSDADNQEEELWPRTGYDIHAYRANYDRLRRLPASDPHPHPQRDRTRFNASHPDVVAWKQRHPGLLDEDYPEATAGYGGTIRGLHSTGSLNYLVRLYLNSRPGGMEVSEHRLMMHLIRPLYNNSRPINDAYKRGLRRVLLTRLELNHRANSYARALNLYKLPPIERWDAARGYRTESYDYATFRRLFTLVSDAHIFHLDPAENMRVRYGPYYRKPAQYLAAAMAAAGYDANDAAAAVDRIRQMRRGMRFVDDPVSRGYLRSRRCAVARARLATVVRDSWSVSESEHPRRSGAGVDVDVDVDVEGVKSGIT